MLPGPDFAHPDAPTTPPAAQPLAPCPSRSNYIGEGCTQGQCGAVDESVHRRSVRSDPFCQVLLAHPSMQAKVLHVLLCPEQHSGAAQESILRSLWPSLATMFQPPAEQLQLHTVSLFPLQGRVMGQEMLRRCHIAVAPEHQRGSTLPCDAVCPCSLPTALGLAKLSPQVFQARRQLSDFSAGVAVVPLTQASFHRTEPPNTFPMGATVV